MKKVLIITYHFPPRPTIGSVRLKGLTKYLPNFGWEPTVLTPYLPHRRELNCRIVETKMIEDASVALKRRIGLDILSPLSNYKAGILKELLKCGNYFYKQLSYLGIVNFPDEQIGWLPYAVEEGLTLLKKNNFDLILSSSMPVTCHLIARRLKEKGGLPWVADLRDLWSQNYYTSYRFTRKIMEKRMEKETLSRADAIVTVSDPLAHALRQEYPRGNVSTITNGFDPDEIKEAPLSKNFTITYTGSTYNGKRDASILFKVLRELVDAGSINSQLIEVLFLGPFSTKMENDIKKFNLTTIVKQLGVVDREEALFHQRRSQVLLLINWNDPREIGVYTGKIFEYFLAKRPILSIGGSSHNVVSDLLKQTKAGDWFGNEGALRERLTNYYNFFLLHGHVPFIGNWEEISKYTHIEMAKKFSAIFKKTLLNKNQKI